MPLYVRRCNRCRNEFEALAGSDECHLLRCPKCRSRTTAIIAAPARSWFKPFVTTHITGKPIRIESQAQLKQVCREAGVVSHYTG